MRRSTRPLWIAASLVAALLAGCTADSPPPTPASPTSVAPTLSPTDLPTRQPARQPTDRPSTPRPATPDSAAAPSASVPASRPPHHGPTPTSGPSDAPSPADGSALAIDWRLAPRSSAFSPSDVVSDATWTVSGLVAVGSYDDGSAIGGAAAWHSSAGLVWQRAADLPRSARSAMEDVTVGSAGIVAVGYSLEDGRIVPAVWRSADGQTWQHIRDADLERGQMSAVAANALGYVALGFAPETGEGLVWSSADGRDWTAAASVPAFGRQPSINDVVAIGDILLAHGSNARDERAALWRSVDGREWQLVERFPSSPGSSVNAVAASGSRLVAVGASYLDEGSQALAWTSVDGLEWQAVLDEQAAAEGEMLGAVAVDSGFVAVGAIGGGDHGHFSAAVWASPDGLSWRRAADDPSFGLARMSDVIAAGSGLVALGEKADDEFGEEVRPTVWLGTER